MNDLHAYPMAALREVAKRLRLSGTSRLRKSELVNRLGERLSEVRALLGSRRDGDDIKLPAESLPHSDVAGSEAGAHDINDPLMPSQAAATKVFQPGVSDSPAPPMDLPNTTSSSHELPPLDRRPMTAASPSGAGGSQSLPLVAPEEPPLDLPWAYDDDRVVLLVRDPRTLYVYWDFHPDTIRRALEGLREPRTVLRLVQLGGSEPKLLREMEIHLDSRSWYLYDCEPNRDYRVHIVALASEGAEVMVGRASNVASLPPSAPSEWIEDRFASLPLDVPLRSASIFLQGRLTGGDRRMHRHAFELSGGGPIPGDEATSSRGLVQGFGGRSWSGTLVRK